MIEASRVATGKSKPSDTLTLNSFIAACRKVAEGHREPADCVREIAPLMRGLVEGDRAFLKPEHLRSDPKHYSRNAIYLPKDGRLSLFAIVWEPGQWTPVHDHGTWGVVGVIEGVLEEHNMIRTDHGDPSRDDGIALARGGIILLPERAVTSFVPNPDHIHKTGVADTSPRTVSLHLYGRELSSFHIYDLGTGCRTLIDVPHNES